MINGQDKKGMIFLGKGETIIFVSFENKKETIILLNNLKRIYFNIRGSSNLRNYNKKSINERFIQFVEMNNKKTDFKFNNDTELEYFIKGLIRAYKNKTPPIDKNILYEKNSIYFSESIEKKEIKGKYTYINKSNKLISDKTGKKEANAQSHYRRRNMISNEDKNSENKNESYGYCNYKKLYNEKQFYETDENNDNNIDIINNENYNEENYEENYNEFKVENNAQNVENPGSQENYEIKDENYEKSEKYYEGYNGNNKNYENNKKENDDDFVTTTKIEVFKDGKLINEETQEEYGGVVRTVHSYSPDIGEYKEYLRKSTLRKSKVSGDDISNNLKRIKD